MNANIHCVKFLPWDKQGNWGFQRTHFIFGITKVSFNMIPVENIIHQTCDVASQVNYCTERNWEKDTSNNCVDYR